LAVCRRTDSGKSSRRRLRAWTELGLLLTLGACGAARAQPTGDAAADGLALLEAFLADVKSLTADFEQKLWTADQRLLETDTGTLSLQRPNRFRWTYREPSELLVVADGRKIWMYDVELEQVTVAPLDESIASSPAMLLSGDRGVRDGFNVVDTDDRDGLDWVKLEPKAAGTDFTSVLIGFNGRVPQVLELVDRLNEITRIELSNVEVNPEIADTAFEFRPPEGVSVLGDRG
jgi:outer membrane lipoprotein carrier protein